MSGSVAVRKARFFDHIGLRVSVLGNLAVNYLCLYTDMLALFIDRPVVPLMPLVSCTPRGSFMDVVREYCFRKAYLHL